MITDERMALAEGCGRAVFSVPSDIVSPANTVGQVVIRSLASTMNSFRILPPLLIGLLTALPIGGVVGKLSAGEPNADDRTPVEHVTKKPRFNTQGLGTIVYRPSDHEQPFFAKLDAEERKTGGLSGDYNLSTKDGVYVGWFGIIRNVSEDEATGRSTLFVEHKYFDGLTDSHIQAISFNGSGDFFARLRGTGHGIQHLSLVKVYGKVFKDTGGGLPRIDAVFIRNWHWGTFTFLGAHGEQRGSEEWRKLNQVNLGDIYNPYPDDIYYEKRLGKRSEDAQRRQHYHRLALDAARDAGLGTDTIFDDNDQKTAKDNPSERVDSRTFRARALRAATAVRPGVESVVGPVIDAIVKEDLVALNETLKAAAKMQAEGAAVAVLAEALKHEKERIRILAAEMLAELGFAARPTVPALIAALNDACEYVRNNAASALGNIGPEARQAVPGLLVTLGDGNSYVRSGACEALGKINAQAKYVVPALIAAMKDGDSHVRWQAVGALGEFEAAATPAATLLRETLLHDADSSVRWNTGEALAAVDPGGRISVPALIEAMKDKTPSVRRFAAKGLGRLGPKARTAAPLLVEALNDKDIGVRIAAAEALWKVDGNADAAVPVLTRELEEKGMSRLWAADALSRIGPEAKDAVPALRTMLSTCTGPWLGAAMHALGNIGPEASAAVPDLVELLDDNPNRRSTTAAVALWKINRYPHAIPILIAEAKRNDGSLPYRTVLGIGEIGPAAQELVPVLIKLLEHRELYMRKAAARALEKVDPSSMPIPVKK
ncbi:MAG: HEAT repeat domain-containing protein [Candidatus Nealsonbacteria bacterium]|nr:HEAT repeat domain-containing protein [Candidatus Nealsonbacteria bacterium]